MYFSFHSSAASKNFDSIQNVTFEKHSSKNITIIIKKFYPRLQILARAISETKFTIHSIRIRYYFCKTITVNDTVLDQVDSSTTNISKRVACPDNAVSNDGKFTNITVNCTPKGKWTFGNQICVCDKGFSFNNIRCSRKYRR